MPRYPTQLVFPFYTVAKTTTARRPKHAGVKVMGPDGKAMDLIVPLRFARIMQQTINKLWPEVPAELAVVMAVMYVHYGQEAISSGMMSDLMRSQGSPFLAN